MDSYLFGHEKGAFTGANQLRKGYFERADQGTLFLDEVGELPLDIQVKLLRILETGSFERVGGQKSIAVDVRIVAATHRDLVQMVNDGQFREDLWYRLNVFPIIVPPLRHRREDIQGLVEYFLAKKSRELKLGYIPKIHPSQLQNLQGYSFPGNVRELQNIIERALIHHDGGKEEFLANLIKPGNVTKFRGTETTKSTVLPLDDVIRDHLKQVLKMTGGRIQGEGGAADLLNMPPSTLRAKLKKLHIR